MKQEARGDTWKRNIMSRRIPIFYVIDRQSKNFVKLNYFVFSNSFLSYIFVQIA